jgi:CBS domain containing-hemolysin-like protein
VSIAYPGKEVLAIVGCLLASAFFSASETGLTALGAAKTRQLAESGRHGFLKTWLQRPEQVLAALLLGNTTANIGAAALATSIIARYDVHAVAIATTLMTFFILFFSEITPKTFAKAYTEWVAVTALPLIALVYYLLWPVAFPLFHVTRWVNGLFAGKRALVLTPSVTSEDIDYLINLGTQEGVLDKVKEELLNSVVEFGDIVVKEVMIPRTKMLTIDRESNPDELLDMIIQSQHSRIPAYSGTVDHIVGVLYAKAIVEDLRKGIDRNTFRLDKYLRAPYFVPEVMKISRLLKEFQRRQIHIAIVVDEFGGTSGLVTLEDVVEELVGEIQDESDVADGPVKSIGDGVYLADGAAPIRDLAELIGEEFPDTGEYETLGGFLVAHAGRVPPAGSVLAWKGFTFTVRVADERRVAKVEIRRQKPPRSSAPNDREGGGRLPVARSA